MARLLFAALSLAVAHGSSYGKMSNSQPWLPLSDGMPLAIMAAKPATEVHVMPRACEGQNMRRVACSLNS